MKSFFAAHEADGIFPHFVGNKIIRRRIALVPMNERVNAATRAVGGDVAQPPRRGVAEIHRERRDDEEMIFLGDAAGLRVVFRDGRVFVAQIHLDDLFHVLVQLGELFLELRRLRPDAAVDVAFLVIGQVHQRGEILAEADRIKNGEAHLARRRGGQQPENDVVDGRHRFGFAALVRLKKNRALERIRQRERHGKIRRPGNASRLSFGIASASFARSTSSRAEFRRVLELLRRRPVFPNAGMPVGKSLFRRRRWRRGFFRAAAGWCFSIRLPAPASAIENPLRALPFWRRAPRKMFLLPPRIPRATGRGFRRAPVRDSFSGRAMKLLVFLEQRARPVHRC